MGEVCSWWCICGYRRSAYFRYGQIVRRYGRHDFRQSQKWNGQNRKAVQEDRGRLWCGYQHTGVMNLLSRHHRIRTVCSCFDDENTQIATRQTVYTKEMGFEAIEDPNSPKIVVDNNSYTMYFSRSIIPFIRGRRPTEWIDSYPFLKHIGLYTYRRHVDEITGLPQSKSGKSGKSGTVALATERLPHQSGMTMTETIGIDTPIWKKPKRSIANNDRYIFCPVGTVHGQKGMYPVHLPQPRCVDRHRQIVSLR